MGLLGRRRLLAGASALLAGASTLLAGCSTGSDLTPGGTDDRDQPGSTGSPPTNGPDGTATASPDADGALDLREANVTGVAVERTDGEYRFDVTLYHDDDGEDGYANWWQVESLDGERLGRRELLHAHGTREFTRSDTFALPDVDCVVVRGHDETHGYGGQAMLVTLETGTTRTVRQEPEPISFADVDCP